jgi:hypothetical protein
MPKTITGQQLTGSRGEAFVEERANAMGFLFTRHGPLDAGIDGFLELRDPVTRAATGKFVAVQVRTTDGTYTGDDGQNFEYLMGPEEVEYWSGCNVPVILVLVHLGRDEALWKSVDLGTGPGLRRLRIDRRTDRFDQTARDAIADLCVSKGGFGVWFPPLKSAESGHLNFVEVGLPKNAFVGAALFKTGRQALFELLQTEDRPPDDWVIRKGEFMSFRDPREGPLAKIVDIGSIEQISSDDVAFPDDEADEHTIIELLRRTLGAQLDGLLVFKRDQKAFYFPADPTTIERTYYYPSLKQQTHADVVKKVEKDGKLKYVRHHAFEPRFWRIGSLWLLSITPTFVFTWDGFRPDRFASGRLAGKKQREFNSALLGQFMMWRHLLSDLGAPADAELFELEPEKEHVLRFLPIDALDLPRGVPDDLWRASEPEAFNDSQWRLPI